MRFIKSSTNVLAVVAAIVLATSACLALSIESEPVKVTNRNSGPRYDIDEDVEPAKLTPVSEQPQQPPKASNGKPQEEDGASSSGDQDQAIPLGHVSIRRIFLVPMMHPPKRYWQEGGADGSEQSAMPGPRPSPDSDVLGQPGMFAKPFWPFLTPARPAHPHHLFGADEASRSPSAVSRPSDDQDKAASGAEREEDQAPLRPPMFDPIQMMVDMMHQAINSELMPPTPNLTDLNKEASSSKSGSESPDRASEERPQMPGGFQLSTSNKPTKPSSQNETREDIVEIEGKKYLRKTVINRHVGENIIFMTKRLIFVPLNETESSEKPATPTTTTVSSLSAEKTDPPTTTLSSASSEETTTKKDVETTPASSEAPVDNKKSTDNKPTEENTSTTTTTSGPATASNEPTTTTTSPEPSSPTSAVESADANTSTAKSTWVDRVTDAVDKAAERLVEGFKSESAPSVSTEKPASSN